MVVMEVEVVTPIPMPIPIPTPFLTPFPTPIPVSITLLIRKTWTRKTLTLIQALLLSDSDANGIGLSTQ